MEEKAIMNAKGLIPISELFEEVYLKNKGASKTALAILIYTYVEEQAINRKPPGYVYVEQRTIHGKGIEILFTNSITTSN